MPQERSSEPPGADPATREIEVFVRKVLGCGCPPEAFSRVEVTAAPESLAGAGDRRLVAIGGRLLLLIVATESLEQVESEVRSLLEAGRALRDAQGFNRFRLVLAAPGVETDDRHQPRDHEPDKGYEVDPRDRRAHLHIVSRERLPALVFPAVGES